MLMVVANRRQARFFDVAMPGYRLTEQRALSNEEGRARRHELVTDRAGARSDAGSIVPGVDSMGPRADPAEQDMIEFAGDVAGVVNEARRKNELDSLAIIAEPGFLGALRSRLDEKTSKLIERTVDKDVVHADEDRLRAYLKGF